MSRSEKHGTAGPPPPDRAPAAEGLGAPAPHPEAGSSTIWLELFLDLVAVAAMVVLATAFEEHATWLGLGIFAVTFAAIWTSWSSLALYVNLADELVERRTIIAGMAAIAVMAACLLDIDAHARVFTLAFLACRLLTAVAARTSGRMTGVATALNDAVPLAWVVSLWVPVPWAYLLWAFGIVADLALHQHAIGPEEMAARLERYEERQERRAQRRGAPPALVSPLAVATAQNDDAEVPPGSSTTVNGAAERIGAPQPSWVKPRGSRSGAHDRAPIEIVPLRAHHLSERLGTFVIIVLGESVLQLVRATSETPWSWQMWIAVTAAFLIIVGIWRQTFSYGFSAAPNAAPVERRLASTMAMHLVMTGSLVVLAASLGVIVRHAGEIVTQPWGWLAGGALACYIACSVLSTVRGRPTLWAGPARAWILGWGVPCAAAALLVGGLAFTLPGWAGALALLVPVTWLVLHDHVRGRHGHVRAAPTR